MSRSDPRSEVRIDVEADTRTRPTATPAHRPSADEPFRIAVLGDFSGRGNRGERRSAAKLAMLTPIRVDRDDLDRVMSSLRPRLRVPTTAPELPALDVVFERIDDFEPDSLYERLPLFEEMRELRRLAADPDRFRAGAEPARPDIPDVPVAPEPSAADGGLLDQILDEGGGSGPPVGGGATRGADLEAFVQRVVAPHTVAATPARQAEVQARIDRAIADQLRELMHHGHFRGLESIWRGLRMLVLGLETDERLQVHLIDVTRDEIEDEMDRADRGEASHLVRLLTDPARTPGGSPWALLVGCYAFRPGQAALLARIGATARTAGAPFLSRAAPALAGAAELRGTPDPREWTPLQDPAWHALRSSAEANWLGLAVPRFVLRLPYGAEGLPTDAVEFEEAHAPPRHEDYLWGNPALLCALLLGRSFSQEGWSMRPEMNLEVDRLPLHVSETPDGAVAQPCAEALLTDDAVARLLDLGFMPLAPFREQDRVRLGRFQSIARPLAPLAGRWG